MSTCITENFFTEQLEEKIIIDEENLSRYIMDLSLDLDIRINALDLYYKKFGGNDTIEIINKLSTIYEMSNTKILRNYLFDITQKNILEPFLQSLCAKTLWDCDKKDILAYKAIETVYPKLGKNIGTPYKIDFIHMLMYNSEYKNIGLEYFCSIINDLSIDCQYRYKTIQKLKNILDKNNELNELFDFYSIKANLCFFYNEKNLIFYRILASQYLLQNLKDKEEKDRLENILIKMAKDINIEYNTRADITDILLQFSSNEIKNQASGIISYLGIGDNKISVIYNDKQNVHRKEVSESVNQALEFLQTFEIMKNNGKTISLQDIQNELEHDLDKEKKEKTQQAFTRIIMDRALYSIYNCSLSHICLKVWTYMKGHKDMEEIKKRFLEELLDMAGTCSSGFASRLVNILSGFGNFSMKISWEDQIISNLTGRLNAKIRDMDNLRIQERVLAEMSIASEEYSSRQNFLKFFRNNILSIREEMYDEFKSYITDTDFDLFFRKAVSMYETGGF